MKDRGEKKEALKNVHEMYNEWVIWSLFQNFGHALHLEISSEKNMFEFINLFCESTNSGLTGVALIYQSFKRNCLRFEGISFILYYFL